MIYPCDLAAAAAVEEGEKTSSVCVWSSKTKRDRSKKNTHNIAISLARQAKMKIVVVDSEWDEPDLKVHRVSSKFDADAVVKLYKSDVCMAL